MEPSMMLDRGPAFRATAVTILDVTPVGPEPAKSIESVQSRL